MPDINQIKIATLNTEIQILKHHIEKTKNTSDQRIQIEHAHNKTLLAQKEFSLAEMTDQKNLQEKRKTLYEVESNTLSLEENLFLKNWEKFPLGNFLRARVPNSIEALISSIPKSLVEALFVSDELKSDPNPTVRAFVRDITKIPSALISWHIGQQIGSTKYHFDGFLLAGTMIKTSCKTTMIFGLSTSIPMNALSRLSNYVCEVPSRVLTRVSRDYQDSIHDLGLEINTLIGQAAQSLELSQLSNSTASVILKEMHELLQGVDVNHNLVEIIENILSELPAQELKRFLSNKKGGTYSSEEMTTRFNEKKQDILLLNKKNIALKDRSNSRTQDLDGEAIEKGIYDNIKSGIEYSVLSLVENVAYSLEEDNLAHIYASLKTNSASFAMKILTKNMIDIILHQESEIRADSALKYNLHMNTTSLSADILDHYKSETTYYDTLSFLTEKLSLGLFTNAVYTSMVKTLTTDVLGASLGTLTQTEYWTKKDLPAFKTLFFDKLRGSKTHGFKDTHHLMDSLVESIPSFGALEYTKSSLPGAEKILQTSKSFVKQFLKSISDTYLLSPPARWAEDGFMLTKDSDLAKSSYVSNKVLHIVDNLIDTKKNYGVYDCISNYISNNTDTLESNLAIVQEEAGKLGLQHDEL
jgi:hypothetical protein